MKATLSASALSEAVRLVSDIAFGGRASSGNYRPVLSLNVEKSHMVVAGVTDTFAVTRRVECMGSHKPSTVLLTVQADELGAAVNCFSPWAMIDLTLGDGPSIILSTSSSTLAVPIRGVGKSLPSEPTERPITADIGAEDLLDLAGVTRLIGVEKFRLEFTQWVVHFSTDGAVSICGNGGIFGVIERREMRPFAASGDWMLTVNTAHVPPLRRLLSHANGGMVSIRNWDGDQIAATLATGGTCLDLFGMPRLPYPDVNKFIERSCRSRLVLEVADIAGIVKRLKDSNFSKYIRAHRPHWTRLVLHDKGSALTFSSLDEKGISDRLGVLAYETDVTCAPEPSITILSEYIETIAYFGKRYGYAEVELVDGSKPLLIGFSDEPRLSGRQWVRDLKLRGLRRMTMLVGIKRPDQP